MDFCRYLPIELIEEIFSYLSAKDLVKCSQVSVIWRDAANNGNLWRAIWEKLSLRDPWALGDIESSFKDPSYQFQSPPLPDRLSPMSEWKICYCQQKYIEHNWRQGRYSEHLINVKNFVPIRFSGYKPNQYVLVYRIMRPDINYEMINIMRIDGEPKLVYQQKLPPLDILRPMLIKGNTITFIIEKKLKTFIYENNEFNMVREYNLGPDNRLNRNALRICSWLGNRLNYFIGTNSSYLLTACEAYFHVWDRKTGDELCFVNCPTDELKMYSFCLQGDCIYFVTSMDITHNKLYEYNIVEKTLSLVDTIYATLERAMLSNELYLILFTYIHNERTVSFYDQSSKKKVKSETYSNEMRLHSIHNNLLFFIESFEVRIMRVPSWTLDTKFKLPYSEKSIIDMMENVGQNLLIISVLMEALDVWDWRKGVRCSSIKHYGEVIWCDPIRLVVESWNKVTNKNKLIVIGFW